jgi:hypothetical protein
MDLTIPMAQKDHSKTIMEMVKGCEKLYTWTKKLLEAYIISMPIKCYVFIFWLFWTYGSLLVEYIKVHKKLKWFGEHLIKKKNFWNKKTTCPHVFLECFKHIKRLLKHGEFSWKTLYLQLSKYKKLNDFIIMFAWWFFKILKNNFKDYPHTLWLFISCFHPRMLPSSYMYKLFNSTYIHYKESYPFQPMCLWLLSKSTIFATLNTIIFHGT